MATQTSPRTSGSARRVLTLPPPLRQLRCDVARWALAEGMPCNLDAITVILAAKAEEARLERRHLHRWSRTGVATFVVGSVGDFMRRHGLRPPRSLDETLYTYLSHLAATGTLASGSAPHPDLLEAVVDNTGLNGNGRRPAAEHAPVPPVRVLVRR